MVEVLSLNAMLAVGLMLVIVIIVIAKEMK